VASPSGSAKGCIQRFDGLRIEEPCSAEDGLALRAIIVSHKLRLEELRVESAGSIVLPSSSGPAAQCPAYDLAEIQRQVSPGPICCHTPRSPAHPQLKFDSTDIEACVLALDGTDFSKTMESQTKPGLMQDVYRPVY